MPPIHRFTLVNSAHRKRSLPVSCPAPSLGGAARIIRSEYSPHAQTNGAQVHREPTVKRVRKPSAVQDARPGCQPTTVEAVRRSQWIEVAPEVFVHAYDHLEINITVVRDGGDLLLVDSRSSPIEAAELQVDLEEFAPGRVQLLVNTHAHFDHTFGNQSFGPDSTPSVSIYGHHLLPAHLDEYERPRLAAWRADGGGEPDREWHDLRITPPDRLVTTSQPVRVGGRTVILHPLGPGHTDTDLVLHVPDGHVWIVGDVVEASGPPMYGSGCFPLELPDQLAFLLGELDDRDVVVPGHGPVVGRAFVASQLAEVERLAQQIRSAHLCGDSVEQALADQGRWPLPVGGLELAVRRAYAHLDNATVHEQVIQSAAPTTSRR